MLRISPAALPDLFGVHMLLMEKSEDEGGPQISPRKLSNPKFTSGKVSSSAFIISSFFCQFIVLAPVSLGIFILPVGNLKSKQLY